MSVVPCRSFYVLIALFACQSVRGTTSADVRLTFDATGYAAFRAAADTAFATWAKATGVLDVRVRTEGPFVFFDVTPRTTVAEGKLATCTLPELHLPAFADKVVRMGSDGLKAPNAPLPSCGYLALAEPFTRRGFVAGWVANVNAVGAFATRSGADGALVVTPILDYGPMPYGTRVREPDTFVMGFFDDARLGLEAYADAAARRFNVRLPPNRSGYCTWCSDRYGYSDRSQFKAGCGAGTEASTREYAETAARLLKPYGFSFIQFDDQWQAGCEINGPARDFSKARSDGGYPHGFRATVDALNARGFDAGLWFIPFGGVADDPSWRRRETLYIRSDADIEGVKGNAYRTPLVLARRKGDPVRTLWGGECLDMTHPDAQAYLAETVRRFTFDWGMRYLKCDGIFTGFGCDLYGGFGWQDVNFDKVRFHDPSASNVQAYRRGWETIRRAAAPGTFLLACNLGTIRAMVPSFGLVDGMRIGNDNGPVDMFPERWLEGIRAGTDRYFYNGRVWRADPDSTYVRATVSAGRARAMASWTAVSDSLFEVGDWLPDLPEDRVEILRRTLAHHGSAAVRPIDYFERELPNAWILDGGSNKVVAVFNWSTNTLLKVDYPFAYTGLDPQKAYVGWDFWRDSPLPPFTDRLTLEVPPDDCRVIALAEVGTGPVVVSTSRHVCSPVFDRLNPTAARVTGEMSKVRRYTPGIGFDTIPSP